MKKRIIFTVVSCLLALFFFMMPLILAGTIIASLPLATQNGGNVTGTGQLLWPVPGIYNMSRGFGTQPNGEFHRAIDIAQKGVILGKPIIAADHGTVVIATYGHSSYGNYIRIDHGNGFQTLYAHCLSLSVSPKQVVSAGEPIGYVGSTGNSTGPHLHFEVFENGSLIDPLTVLQIP